MEKNLYEKKGSILYVLNILKKFSNEDNPLSSKKIASKIEELYAVTIDSRTVRRDIELLTQKFGYDIETWNENKRGYFIRNDPDKEFELGELSIIINTFAYSNFVPEKIGEAIVHKCLNMMNVYETSKYQEYKASIKNTKTENIEVIKNIEDINEAIYKHRKISFDYYKYSFVEATKVSEEKVNVTPYIVSPYKLIYALQKFYLVCLKDGKKDLLTYRVDKIKDINILKTKTNNKFSDTEVDFFVKNNVAMFMGDSEKVEIVCNMKMLDNVIELYGKDIKIKKLDEENFIATFYTNLAGFKFWCLRNTEYVRVLSPLSLKKSIHTILEEYLKS